MDHAHARLGLGLTRLAQKRNAVTEVPALPPQAVNAAKARTTASPGPARFRWVYLQRIPIADSCSTRSGDSVATLLR